MPTVAPISVTVAGPSRSRNRSSDGSINITDEPNTARVRVGDRRRNDACRPPARIADERTFRSLKARLTNGCFWQPVVLGSCPVSSDLTHGRGAFGGDAGDSAGEVNRGLRSGVERTRSPNNPAVTAQSAFRTLLASAHD